MSANLCPKCKCQRPPGQVTGAHMTFVGVCFGPDAPKDDAPPLTSYDEREGELSDFEIENGIYEWRF